MQQYPLDMKSRIVRILRNLSYIFARWCARSLGHIQVVRDIFTSLIEGWMDGDTITNVTFQT